MIVASGDDSEAGLAGTPTAAGTDRRAMSENVGLAETTGNFRSLTTELSCDDIKELKGGWGSRENNGA